MKKVLIIDDSALMRSIMSDIINAEAEMTVAETAKNGLVATEILEKDSSFDLILLDINMPKMNGIAFLNYLNEKGCRIPTLVVSSIASRSAKETILALELGAYDFVKKPEGRTADSSEDFKEQLLMKVRCVAHLRNYSAPKKKKTVLKEPVTRTTPAKEPILKKPAIKEPTVKKPTVKEPVTNKQKVSLFSQSVPRHNYGNLIVIASSTGGPKALQKVVPAIPQDIGCPILIVQHMPAGFTSSLADRLDEMSPCKVIEAEEGMVLENGVIYIAKGGCQMKVVPGGASSHALTITKEAPRNGLRPCADILLESLVDTGYRNIFCAVLTGMGSDAKEGLLHLKRYKDVYVVGQSEESCVVYGMPCAVMKAGIVDTVSDLMEIGETLVNQVRKK